MGILDKIITNDGIIPKTPTQKAVENIVKSAVVKTIHKTTTGSKGSNKHAKYGDVIGVRRNRYKHFGVYINDNSIIHYASPNGDFGKDIYIHETTLKKFLDGSNSYFVCEFPPKTYGKPTEINIKTTMTGYFPNQNPAYELYELYKLLKRINYKVYSPEETVKRARSRLGETKYNLALNNCEHFAIWCKTGISESHQVNDILDILILSTVHK